jgi:hypothetical protein
MPRISTYRGYQIYFVKGHSSWDEHWAAHRPDSDPGDSFDLKSTSFDKIRAEIDSDEAGRALRDMMEAEG